MKTHLERLEDEIRAQESPRLGEESTYRLYEDVSSPYSAKVRAYLSYKRIPFRRLRATFASYLQRIPELVGFPTLPVLLAPDGSVLQDSTPMLEHLEARFPEPRTIPEDPRVAFVQWLVEDFADEYAPRWSMHYRWGNEPSRDTLSRRIARRFSYGDPHADASALASLVLARQSGFDAHLGLDDETRPDLDSQLLELLGALDARFVRHAFLFGDRPSVADFALYGQLFAHLFNDPFSMRILETRGPQTCNWIESITELGDTRGAVGRTSFGPFVEWTDAVDGLGPLWSLISSAYVPVGAETARSAQAREKRMTLMVRGLPTTMSTAHYRAWAFEKMQLRFDALSEAHRVDVQNALGRHGDFAPFLTGPRLHNTLYDGLNPPFIVDGLGDNRVKYRRGLVR